ncbi:oligoribonuclease [Mycobacteroides abscessus subsp. abscessus]|nr:oligoribonuclease [Mycobacteroides abscessus subsp. abscessus]SLC77194.1 oligoribonuclease [Mycobacteroides abscessus subsp. abscessus]
MGENQGISGATTGGSDRLAVIDVETTGLDVSTDLLLEVGIVIIDSQLREIAHQCVLIASPDNVAWAKHTYAQWDRGAPLDPAQTMHINNWLISDLYEPMRFSRSYAEGTHMAVAEYQRGAEHLCAFLDEHGITERVPLVGSSVRSLDGPFLALHMPKLFARFTHRTIDASALTELARFVDPVGYEELAVGTPESGHRTIEDCRRSIGIIRAFGLRYGIGSLAASSAPTAPTN